MPSHSSILETSQLISSVTGGYSTSVYESSLVASALCLYMIINIVNQFLISLHKTSTESVFWVICCCFFFPCTFIFSWFWGFVRVFLFHQSKELCPTEVFFCCGQSSKALVMKLMKFSLDFWKKRRRKKTVASWRALHSQWEFLHHADDFPIRLFAFFCYFLKTKNTLKINYLWYLSDKHLLSPFFHFCGHLIIYWVNLKLNS